MELRNIQDAYRDPPTILCVGLLILCAGVLLCMFGSAAQSSLLMYILLTVPIFGATWMSFGLVKMHLIQKRIDERIQAQKAKEKTTSKPR